METLVLFIVFVFIILIFITMNIFQYSENKYLLLGIIAVATFVFFGYITDVSKISEYFKDGTEMNDLQLSKYGNISISEDLDQTQQRLLGIDDEIPKNPISMSYDNSDIVHAAVTRGSSYFQPNWKGISPLSSGQYTNFNLAEPARNGDTNQYSLTMSGSQNVDELMARKQADRSYRAKQALDGHVRATKNLYQRYFTNELEENEQKEWWGAESATMETDFWPWM